MRLLLPGVALAVLLVAVYFVQAAATSTLSWNVREQARAEREVSLAYQSETLLLDLETGVRGYLLTHDRKFLDPWQSARTEFPARSALLANIERGSGSVDLGLAATIVSEGDAYINDFAVPQVRLVETDPKAARSVAAALEGKRRVDALRLVFAELIRRDQDPAAPAERAAQAAAGRASAYELAGLVGALALLAISALYLGRAVLRPILRVGNAADAMAAGDLAVRVEPASAAELSHLASSFNAMADALQDGQARLEDQAAKLRRSEVFLDSVLEHIPDMLVVRDAADLRFVLFNRAGEELLGYPRGDLLGKTARDVFAPEVAGSLDTEDRATLASGVPLDIVEEAVQTRDQGLRYLHTKKVPVMDDDGVAQYLLVVSEDVTERKRSEELLRDAKEQAELANRAKSEFLSRMSHELRTPLNSILGFGQLLEMDGLSEEQREPVHFILDSGRHLLALINEVLDIARIEAGKVTIFPESVAVAPLLAHMVAVVSPLAAEHDIVVTIERAQTERHVRADPHRLKQVLLNLLANAIKYNREGGEVRIACELAGPTLRLCVSDTGHGLSAEELADVFAPFERLGAERGDVEGSGLGLSLSQDLMGLMGGTLTAESERGVGSTFTATLELAEEAESSGRVIRLGGTAEAEVEADAVAPAVRILQIEDNLVNIKLVERVLDRRPEMAVEATMLGRLGIELARHHPPDVIILDLGLPDMSGEQVMDALKGDARTERIPVIILTGDLRADRGSRLVELGAACVLTHPLDAHSFLAALDEVVRAAALVPR